MELDKNRILLLSPKKEWTLSVCTEELKRMKKWIGVYPGLLLERIIALLGQKTAEEYCKGKCNCLPDKFRKYVRAVKVARVLYIYFEVIQVPIGVTILNLFEDSWSSENIAAFWKYILDQSKGKQPTSTTITRSKQTFQILQSKNEPFYVPSPLVTPPPPTINFNYPLETPESGYSDNRIAFDSPLQSEYITPLPMDMLDPFPFTQPQEGPLRDQLDFHFNGIFTLLTVHNEGLTFDLRMWMADKLDSILNLTAAQSKKRPFSDVE